MDLGPLYVIAFGVATTIALLLALELAERRVALDLTEGNSAQRFLRVGQVLAVFLVAASACKSIRGEGLGRDAAWVAAFAFAGLALVVVTGQIGIRLLLQNRLPKEIARGNSAAGLAAGAHYVATGIVTSSALAGHDLRDLGLSLAFFAI